MSEPLVAAEVLVADDSVTTTAVLKMLLERAGYRVRVAYSGVEALEEVAKALPDLVLCDIEMPGLDGYQVLEQFRANPAADCIPFVLITSKTGTEDKIRGLDRGASDYITKPFKIEELKARIRTHLRVKGLQDEIVAKNRELSAAHQQLEEKIEALRSAYQRIADHQMRTRRALDLASKVQRGLLPSAVPRVAGYTIESVFRPAEEVAGDFYDFFDLGSDRLGIAIGDVAGKGVAASLVMVLIRTLLRSVALSGKSPKEVLERVNQLVIKDYGTQDSTTLFYGTLDHGRGAFTFSNGGHEFPILVSGDGKSSMELCVGGPFLGIFPKARYNEGQVFLRGHDRVTLFTDGLYHLPWASGRPESPDRLVEILKLMPGSGLETVMHELGYDPSAVLGAGEIKGDDITVIQIARESSPAVNELGGLVIHNSLTNVRETDAMLVGLEQRAGLAGEARRQLHTAVGAILDNAIKHAYQAENAGLIELRVEGSNGLVTVQVKDRGRGIDEATRSKILASGGGFRLARGLTDAFDVASEVDVGTTVTLRKKG